MITVSSALRGPWPHMSRDVQCTICSQITPTQDLGILSCGSALLNCLVRLVTCLTAPLSPPCSTEVLNAHKAPLYNKHLIINLNRIISIFVWLLEFRLICKSSFKCSDQLTNKKVYTISVPSHVNSTDVK